MGPSWSPKRAYDAQLWNESTLRDAVITNSIDIPQQGPLPGDDQPYRIYAFAPNEWMMKPFAAAPLEQDESSLIAFLAPDDALRMPLA